MVLAFVFIFLLIGCESYTSGSFDNSTQNSNPPVNIYPNPTLPTPSAKTSELEQTVSAATKPDLVTKDMVEKYYSSSDYAGLTIEVGDDLDGDPNFFGVNMSSNGKGTGAYYKVSKKTGDVIGLENKPIYNILKIEKETANSNSNTKEAPSISLDERIYKFLNEHNALSKINQIIFQDVQDLNADGNKEIVIATGKKGDIVHIFVLRDTGNQLENLSDDSKVNNGYQTNNVKLVKLKGSKKTYIYVGKTNGAGMNGFQLYELRNNKVEYLAGGTNPTGAGETELTDLDSEGTYGGYLNKQYSYDVFYIPTTSTYKFNGSTFDLKNVQATLPQLPNSPEDVLDQFIKLSLLEIEDQEAKHSIIKRIEQLSSGYKLEVSKDEKYALRDFIVTGSIDKTKELHKGDKNIVIPITDSSISGKISMEFLLSLEDGHWLVKSANRLN